MTTSTLTAARRRREERRRRLDELDATVANLRRLLLAPQLTHPSNKVIRDALMALVSNLALTVDDLREVDR